MFYMISLYCIVRLLTWRDTENWAHFEGSGIWNADGKVCKYSQKFIRRDGSEGKIMGDFVDSEEEIVVSCPSDGISREEE